MDETQMDRVPRREGLERTRDRDQREREQLGWFREFLRSFELAWQLLWDNRVPLSTKLVPLLAVLYIVSPIDIIPDYLLGIGQVDDLLLAVIGMRMFISLAPPEVVAQYTKFGAASGDRTGEDDAEQPEIIEVEPRVPPDSWDSATLRPRDRKGGLMEKGGNKDL
jgi:uncharacterized membrane protein YkvA (DUF1232 family)